MAEAQNAQIDQGYVMTLESIEAYIQHERERGLSDKSLRSCRRVTSSLYEFLGDDKRLSAERLHAWRQSLEAHGYAPQTLLHYVKGINRYLDFAGLSELRFNRGSTKDVAGMRFGYLTAIGPTGEKDRTDRIWRCVCDCGKELECTATRLLSGNTLICGCLRKGHFKAANMYIDGTSLRQALEEQVFSARAESGYTGVTKKRGMWAAYISYKGQKLFPRQLFQTGGRGKGPGTGKGAGATGCHGASERLRKAAPGRA